MVQVVFSNFAGAFFDFAISKEPARLLRAARGRLVFLSAASFCLCPLGYGVVIQFLSSFVVFASRIFLRRGNPAFFTFVFIFCFTEIQFHSKNKSLLDRHACLRQAREDGSDNAFLLYLTAKLELYFCRFPIKRAADCRPYP